VILTALAVGLITGGIVTMLLHNQPEHARPRHLWDLLMGHGWGARLGRTRFRCANLPVGGALTAGAALLWPSLAVSLLVVAAGMTVSAVGWRYVDPLPATPRRASPVFDYRAAYLSLREDVLRILDGDGPPHRSTREQLDAALNAATTAGAPASEMH
jgi:hypothetical protein